MQCWISRFALLRLIDSNVKSSHRYWSSARQPNSRNFTSLQLSNIGIVPYHPKNNNLVQYFYFALNKSSGLSGGGRNARHPNEKKTAETTTAKLFRPLPVLPRSSIYRLFFSAKKKESRKFCTQGYIRRANPTQLFAPSGSVPLLFLRSAVLMRQQLPSRISPFLFPPSRRTHYLFIGEARGGGKQGALFIGRN